MGGEQEEAAQGELRKPLTQFSGLSFSLYTFLSERIQETLSGYTASVVVNIYGTDLDHLDRKAQQVARGLNGMPGATEVQMQSPSDTPEVDVPQRTPELLHGGFDPVIVLKDIPTAYQVEQRG